MSAPKKMPSPRLLIHKAVCATQFECKYDVTHNENTSVWCQALDELLDFNDEQLLHAKARDFRAGMQTTVGVPGGGHVSEGLARAVEMTDPYWRIPAATEYDEVPPGTELYPDCPSCNAGKEHYHRKSDGSRVRVPQLGEEGRNE